MEDNFKHTSSGSTLKVREVIWETPDAISLIFDPPGKNFQYKPGQYIEVTLNLPDKQGKRYFSITSSPFTDRFLSITIKKVIDGKSSWLYFQQIKPGTVLEVTAPTGKFTPELNEFHEYQYVFFAGGSGITPLISMIKSILSEEPKSEITLVYQNHNESSIIFYDKLEVLEKANDGRFRIIHILSQPHHTWQVRKGRINKPMIADILMEIPRLHIQKGQYYLCGPTGMEKIVLNYLEFLGVPETNIKLDS